MELFSKIFLLFSRLSVLGPVIFLSLAVGSGWILYNTEREFYWPSFLSESNERVREFRNIEHEHKNLANFVVTVTAKRTHDLVRMLRDVRVIFQGRQFKPYVKSVTFLSAKNYILEHSLMVRKPSDINHHIRIMSDPNMVAFFRNLNRDLTQTFINPPAEPEPEVENEEDSEAESDMGGEESEIAVREPEPEVTRSREYEILRKNENRLIGILDGVDDILRFFEYFIRRHKNLGMGRGLDKVLIAGGQKDLSKDNRTGIVFLQLIGNNGESGSLERSVIQVKKRLERFGRKNRVPVGMVGIHPMKVEESLSVERGGKVAAGIVLALVFLLSLLVLKGKILASIIVTISTFGTLLISNVLYALYFSSLGGVNFVFVIPGLITVLVVSMYLATVYFSVRHEHENSYAAFVKTLDECLLPVAIVFLAQLVVAISLMVGGFAEDGSKVFFTLIGGIAASLLSIVLFLIPGISVFDTRAATKPFVAEHSFLNMLSSVFASKVTLVVVLAVSAFMFFKGSKSSIEYNHLKLVSEWEMFSKTASDIESKFNYSPDVAMVTAEGLQESFEFTEKFRQMENTGFVDTVNQFILPESLQKQNLPLVRELKERVSDIEFRPLSKEALTRQFSAFSKNLRKIQQMAKKEGFVNLAGRLHTTVTSRRGDFFDDLNRRIMGASDDKIQTISRDFYNHAKKRILKITSDRYISEDEFDKSLLSRYMNEKSGKYIISIFPQKVRYNKEFLEKWDSELKTIAPEVVSLPVLMLNLVEKMWSLVAYLLPVSLVLFFLAFLIVGRSFMVAVVISVSMIVSLGWMLGGAALLGLKWNFLSLLAPVLFVLTSGTGSIIASAGYRMRGLSEYIRKLLQYIFPCILVSIPMTLFFDSPPYRYAGLVLIMGFIAMLLTSMSLGKLLVRSQGGK